MVEKELVRDSNSQNVNLYKPYRVQKNRFIQIGSFIISKNKKDPVDSYYVFVYGNWKGRLQGRKDSK